MEYKIDFEKLDWLIPFEGIRHKIVDQENIRIRLVEYDRSMPPHWCENPHFGIVLDGVFEIEFAHEILRYEKGDGLYLPAGKKHRHRGRAITDKVLIYFVETPAK